MTSAPSILEFLDYVLDARNARLQRGRNVVPLRPKPFALLRYLAERPGQLVTKDELLRTVWADTPVTDWALTTAVRELRETLGDDARQPRIVETVHRRGYRFVAPMRAAESDSVTTDPSGAERARPAATSLGKSIVGRQGEIERLERHWQRALAAERQIVFVAGEAGIGKTTLVDTFLRHLGDHDAPTRLVARGQCIEQHGAGEPYLPVIEALGRLSMAPDGAPLVQLLRRHAPAWLVQIPGLLEPAESEALERRLGVTPRERMLREMAALVAALETPLVLVLEDLHWSDRATLDLVSTLAQRRDPSRLLLIGTYRAVEVALHDHPLRAVHQDLRARALCEDVWLEPLGATAVAEYLESRWPGVTANAALATVLHELTDGNALFLVGIADYLATSGALVAADGGWRLQTAPKALATAVPQRLREVIATQIDHLDEAERRALEVGSLVGRAFSAALVAAALDGSVVEIETLLAELSDSGLMIDAAGATEWPDGVVAGAYRFDHFLYQSVLRERVPPARRRQLHDRIATRLEAAYRDQRAEVSAELAYHFEASGQGERAVPYLEEAAARATRMGANHEAASLLEHAIATLEALPATPDRTLQTIRLSIALGPALAPASGYGGAAVERTYQRARRLSEEANDPAQLFISLVVLTGTAIAQARFDSARETSERMQALLASMPLPTFEFLGNMHSAIVTYHTGDLREAREMFERVAALDGVSLPPMSLDMHTVVHAYLGITLAHLGFPDRGRAEIRIATERAAASGRPFDRILPAQVDCFVQMLVRDMDGLAAAAARAAGLEDFPVCTAVARFCEGRVLSTAGEHARALASMRDGIDAYRATGQMVSLPSLLAALAEAYSAAGDAAAALACVDDARAAVRSTGESRFAAEIHRIEAELHAARGDRGAAARCFEQAVAAARAQTARWLELRATTSWARAALEGGAPTAERHARRDELGALVATFDEGSDAADVRDARALLERLG